MNLTAMLLLAACLQVAANTKGQTVTLSVKDASLTEVFSSIQKQTGLNFLVDADIMASAKPVSLDVRDQPVEQVMQLCLRNQPFEFSMGAKLIVVRPKKAEQNNVAKKSPSITGVVKGPDGKPLANVSITVKGTRKGTSTDKDGRFSIEVEDGKVLVISSVGFGSKELKVTVPDAPLIVALEVSASPMDEVQVIAYGETSKRFSTSNITTVKAEDIEKQPVNNPLLALQGRVPGMSITQQTGLPGSGVRVRIQGQNSLSKGSDPLYIIDGMPYTSQLLRSLNMISPLQNSDNQFGANGNPLSFLNAADIERIDVLKDADATAIYGSRAANGAIIITTKRGKAAPTQVSFNIQNGWGKVGRKLDLLSREQYLEMRHEALKNDNIDLNSPPYNEPIYKALLFPDLTLWDTTRYTDWQKEIIGHSAKYTDIQGTVTGGTDNTQFLLGLGYHRETSVYPADFSDRKASAHFNINNRSANQKFRLQFTGNYMADVNRLPRFDLTYAADQLSPVAPALYSANGALNWEPNSLGTSTFANPLASWAERRYNINTNNLISSLMISYEILTDLELKSNFGYNELKTEEIMTTPMTFFAPENRPYSTREAQFGYSKLTSWNIEPQISYKKAFGLGKLETLVGTTLQQDKSNSQQIHSWGYVSDLVLEDMKAAAGTYPMYSDRSEYRYNAIFARLTFNIKDKYILNSTGRRDGSSRFGPENRFQNYGAVGAAWLFSMEPWMKSAVPFLTFGKLRASYGTLGNSQIGDYQYLNLYSNSNIRGLAPYQGSSGLMPDALANPYLQWEITRKLQFGLDFGMFNDRVQVEANYFRNRSSNQLISFQVPSTTGFQSVTSNFSAKIQNSGLEFTLTTTNLKSRYWHWTTGLNITAFRNKLVAFPGIEETSYRHISVGESIYTYKRFNFVGVNDTTGLYEYLDSKGNLTNNPMYGDDNYEIVKIDPTTPYSGAFRNSISFKGIQLDFLFQFEKKKGTGYAYGNSPGEFLAGYGNQPITVLNRWQKPGDTAPVQKYGIDGSLSANNFYFNQSSGRWEDASYIRLRNISLSWQLPDLWKKKLHLENCQLYIHGQNIFIITKYSGRDPEALISAGSLPPLRVITTGVQVTF